MVLTPKILRAERVRERFGPPIPTVLFIFFFFLTLENHFALCEGLMLELTVLLQTRWIPQCCKLCYRLYVDQCSSPFNIVWVLLVSNRAKKQNKKKTLSHYKIDCSDLFVFFPLHFEGEV